MYTEGFADWFLDKFLWIIERLVDLLFWCVEGFIDVLPEWSFAEGGSFGALVDFIRGFDRFVSVAALAGAIGVYLSVYVVLRTWRPLAKILLGSRSPL